MTALPPNPSKKLQADVHVHALSAYNKCLDVERTLQEAVNNGQDVESDLIYIRILGYLLQFVPTDLGLKTVVHEIVSANSWPDRALLDVGKMYFDHYIRVFRTNKGHTPTPFNHPSRPSFDTIADMLRDILEEAPHSYTATKKHALYRDGYRCVVTGKYDTNSVWAIKELRERLDADRSLRGPTQCAHIFSQTTNQYIEPDSHKRDFAATMWAVMERFGYTTLPSDLNGPNIHRLENVMTLNPEFHIEFDELKVWFVATAVDNTYKLEAADQFILLKYPEYVTFKTPDPLNFPVPSAEYLAIHAGCAKVAHLSGAGAYIDKLYQDMEDNTTLDPNGVSADLLEHAILELQARPCPSSVNASEYSP